MRDDFMDAEDIIGKIFCLVCHVYVEPKHWSRHQSSWHTEDTVKSMRGYVEKCLASLSTDGRQE